MRGKAAQQATHVCVIIIHACRFPTIFHSIVGKDEQEQNSPSWFNAQEAKLVIKYVEVGAVRQQAGQASRCRPWAGSQAGKLASWQAGKGRQTGKDRQAVSWVPPLPPAPCVCCAPPPTHPQELMSIRRNRVTANQICVITPYRRQVQRIRTLLTTKGYGSVQVGWGVHAVAGPAGVGAVAALSI